MNILILAEHDNQQVKSATWHVIEAAKLLGNNIDMCVLGHQCGAVVSALQQCGAVRTVLVADNTVYEHQLAENTAAVMVELMQGYDYLLAPATTFGKNVLPRIAALLNVEMVSDVVKINSGNTFVRPIYAGNVLATVELQEAKKLMTVRATAFPAVALEGGASAAVQKIEAVVQNSLSQFESQALTKSERPELTAARVVVSGGRALKSAENFQLIEALADQLGAAVGASRAAVDAGFAPNDYQVGQTGKVVAPELYIAVGISGAIQHVAGMKESKVIVAINNDPEAPIFEVADYGLVGDLFTVLPELQRALKAS